MKKTSSSGLNLTCVLPLLFVFLNLFSPSAQSQYSIQINPPSNPDTKYTFSLANAVSLPENSLVFYRFSDGYHMFSEKTDANVDASVSRSFPAILPGSPSVVAYVAEKGGPLGIALPQSQAFIATCNDCSPPDSGMPEGDQILLGYSWLPFTSNVSSFVDPGTTSPFTTPNEPWFFLIVSMKPEKSGQLVTVDIPEGFTYITSIFRNNAGSTHSYPTTSPINSILSMQPDKVEISLNNPPKEVVNVYLLLKGTPVRNIAYQFVGTMLRNGNPVSESRVTLEGGLHPHDPNILTATPDTLCPGVKNADLANFRVEFQNSGHAPTTSVQVMVEFPALDIYDPTSLIFSGPQGVTLTGGFINNQLLEFDFPQLALPGLYQLPQPDYAETVGWIEFSVRPRDCLSNDEVVFTKAVVSFIAPGFREEVAAEPKSQTILYTDASCPKPDPDCGPDPNSASRGDENSKTATTGFIANCYPTVFDDVLQIEVAAAPEGGLLKIYLVDCTGKVWLESSELLDAGDTRHQQISTAHLPDGVYFVHIKHGAHTTIRKTFKIRI